MDDMTVSQYFGYALLFGAGLALVVQAWLLLPTAVTESTMVVVNGSRVPLYFVPAENLSVLRSEFAAVNRSVGGLYVPQEHESDRWGIYLAGNRSRGDVLALASHEVMHHLYRESGMSEAEQHRRIERRWWWRPEVLQLVDDI